MSGTRITDQQVRIYMNNRKHHPQKLAAANSGMSERTARRVEHKAGLPTQYRLTLGRAIGVQKIGHEQPRNLIRLQSNAIGNHEKRNVALRRLPSDSGHLRHVGELMFFDNESLGHNGTCAFGRRILMQFRARLAKTARHRPCPPTSSEKSGQR